jgi:arylsulfatase A-like enzyme
MWRRALLLAAILGGCRGEPVPLPAPPVPTAAPTPPAGPPNFVLILADDLGYGDLSSFGAPRIRTPNLDRLAAEGARLTHFSTPAPICAAARAALMTGRYPIRTGIPWNTGRLDDTQITLAEALRPLGYATFAVGKWHLGYEMPDLPLQRGFDDYYGALDDNSPLLRGNDVVSESWGPELFTQRYTEEALARIRGVHDRPFFLYLAHRSPHVPLYASPRFLGLSPGGLYGDVVEELDWGVGEIARVLRETGLDRRTLVFFASDNGPAIAQGAHGGSPGPFYGGKGLPFEGGLRQPAIAWWPGRILSGRTIAEPTSILDVFPTVLALAGGRLPSDRSYGGQDIHLLLTGETNRIPGPGEDGGRELLAYIGREPVALRSGTWKYLKSGYWSPTSGLFDLATDPGEGNDLRAARPELAARLAERLETLAGEVATR